MERRPIGNIDLITLGSKNEGEISEDILVESQTILTAPTTSFNTACG
jgi:hypothetical protein